MRTQVYSESRPQVVLFGVLPHHAPGGELRHEGNHGSTNPLEPLPRDSLGDGLVKQGNHLLRQDRMKLGAMRAILFFPRVGRLMFTRGRTTSAVIPVSPPAVRCA